MPKRESVGFPLHFVKNARDIAGSGRNILQAKEGEPCYNKVSGIVVRVNLSRAPKGIWRWMGTTRNANFIQYALEHFKRGQETLAGQAYSGSGRRDMEQRIGRYDRELGVEVSRFEGLE